MTGLSVIIPSSGRRSLSQLLGILAPQMDAGDELLVDVNDDGDFGNSARNRLMPRARSGNGLVFLDDDDQPVPGALHCMRTAYLAEPDRMHIFRMHFRGSTLWNVPEVLPSNVSTQMICVPCSWALYSQWSNRYEADYDFIKGIADRFGKDSIVWHRDIVAVHNGLSAPPVGVRTVS